MADIVHTRITPRGVIQERVRTGGPTGLTIEVNATLMSGSSLTSRQSYTAVGSGTFLVTEAMLSTMLEVDPNSGSTTVYLPDDINSGFFASIRQVGSGSVAIAVTGSAAIYSTAGAAPTLSSQWSHATFDKRNGTDWVVAGDIA